MHDPFKLAVNHAPIKSNGVLPNWAGLINPADLAACKRIGVRAAAVVQQMRPKGMPDVALPHPIIASMDFAVVHIARPLALAALESTDDLSLLAEYLQIVMHIDRERCHWNRTVELRFYRDACN
jgi:hypothetical protein